MSRRLTSAIIFRTSFVLGVTLVLTLISGCGPSSSDNSKPKSKLYPDLPSISDLKDANGFLATAEKTAGFISDPIEKATVLSEISKAHVQAGNADNAKQTASQLAQYAGTLPQQDVTTSQIVLPILAQAQAYAGDIAAAEKTARTIPEEAGQSDAWKRIVAARAERGDITGAIKTISQARFTVAAHQYAALSAVAMETAIRGDKRNADIVSRNVEPHWRPKVYSDAANGLRQRGDDAAASALIQKAISAANAIRDKEPTYQNANRAQALISIGNVQATWGDKSGAQETLRDALKYAEKIGRDSSKSWDLHDDILAQLITTLLQAGDNATAVTAANSLKDATVRSSYVASARSGKPIVTPDMENAATAPVESPIVAVAKKGDIEAAKKRLEDVLEPAQRAMLLTQVGEALTAKAGK